MTERQHCSFEAHQDGEGRPSRVYIDLAGPPSTLTNKQIGRLFFGLRKNVSWDEVNELVDEMNKKIDLFCVNHLDNGEDS